MLSRKRRIASDEGARVPFAVLAVMILLLSSYSVAYLGAITRQETVNRLLRSDLLVLDEIVAQLQNELRSGMYLIGVKTIQDVLEESNSPSAMTEQPDYKMVNRTLQSLLNDYLSKQFPSETNGYRIDEVGHQVNIFPKVERTVDLVARGVSSSSDNDSYDFNNHSRIDTKQSWIYGPTNTTHSYLIAGYLNVSVRHENSGLNHNRTFWLEREIDVPLPFMLRKMESFQSNSVGSTSEIARLTKYILTTIAQFKAFQGYGMKMTSIPSMLSEELQVSGGGPTDVLTIKDVELAVNLAILLEYAKTFRSWDPEAVDAIHNHATLAAQSSGQYSPVETLAFVLSKYSTESTIDAADLVCLYLGFGKNGGQGVNLEAILAQATYGVLDQFVLKYLDYSGMMPFVDEVWKGVQTIDGILHQAGNTIQDIWDWFAGSSSESWHDVIEGWLRQKMVQEGGLEEQYFLRLLVGDRSDSKYKSFNGEIIDSLPVVDIQEDGFVLTFVVRLSDEYHTWYSNGSGQPHRYWLSDDDIVTGYDYIRYTLEIGFYSPKRRIVFEELNIGEEISESEVWLDFFERYFARKDGDRSAPESLRESIREIALGIAEDAIRRIGNLVDDQEYASGVNPSDERSFLADLRDEITSAMEEVVDFYRSPEGLEETKNILASFSSGDFGLLEDLRVFLAERFDDFVDYQSILQSVTESVAFDLLWNHMSFQITNEEQIENTNVGFDWTYNGNLTQDLLPPEEISRLFLEGGAESQEQFSCLRLAVTDYVDSAYQQVKRREIGIGTNATDEGVIAQAIREAEEEASRNIVSLFVGGAIDVLDGVGLLDMTLEAVDSFVEGMVDGADASNAQYILPLRHAEPFEFWEGDYDVASEASRLARVNLEVDQIQDYLPAVWSNIDSSTIAPEGVLLVDFNSKGFEEGDTGYDPGDIRGKHYTDVMSVTERPFETKWNLTVLGRVPIHIKTQERTLIGPGGHQPIWLGRSIKINFSTTVVVCTGWEFDGVDYDLTSTFLSDIIEFLNFAWEKIQGPLMDVIDYFQIASDFFRDVLRTLLEYGSQALKVIGEATDLAVTLLQTFLSEILSVVSDGLEGFLRHFGLEHFFIEFAGLTFEVKLTNGKEREDCQCNLWVRARGDVIGLDLDFVTYLIEFQEPVDGVENHIIVEGRLRFGQGGVANITIDPFILIHPYLVEIHAIDLNGEGNGWALDLHSPEVDIYKSASTSLSNVVGFVPSVPIPMLGVEIGVDLGISVKYRSPHPGVPVVNFRLVLYEILRESFLEAWQEIGMPLSLDSVEKFTRAVVRRFINKLIGTLEDTIIEVVLFVDVSVSAIGSGGGARGGLRLGFVVDGTVLIELLHWIIDAFGMFIQNLHNPLDSRTFATFPDNLPERLGIRFELYLGMSFPRALRKLSWTDSSDQLPKKMDVAISIQPNVPAVVMLAGLDWGKWKVDFGIYAENFPLSSLGNIYSVSKESVVDLYILKGQIQEMCGSCQ